MKDHGIGVLAKVQQGDQEDRMIHWIKVVAGRRTNVAVLPLVVAEIGGRERCKRVSYQEERRRGPLIMDGTR